MTQHNPVTQVELTGTRRDTLLLLRNLLAIALPSFANALLISLASFFDTLMVSRLGSVAIASVGIVFQPLLIFSLVEVVFSASVATYVSQRRGREDHQGALDMVAQCLVATAVCGVVPLMLGLLGRRQIVAFMGAEPQVVPHALAYWQCVIVGFLPNVLTRVINAAFIAVGEARKVLWISTVSNCVNLLFNFLLIEGRLGFPRLEVRGAGIATAISWYVGFLISLVVCLSGRSYLSLRRARRLLPDRETVGLMLRVGLPVLAARLSIRIGVLMMTRIITSMGTAVFAAHQICCRIQEFSLTAAMAFCDASTSLVGQCTGAEKPALARRYLQTACRSVALVTALYGAGTVLFSRQLAALFSAEGDVYTMMFPAFVMMALFAPFQGLAESIFGGLAGFGVTRPRAVAATVGIVAIRPGLALLLTRSLALGLTGVWMATAADEIFRWAVAALVLRRVKWSEAAALQ